MLTSFHSLTWPLHQVCMGKCFSIQYKEKKIFSIILFLCFIIFFNFGSFNWWATALMLLCIIGSICFFFFFALMLLCSIWFLDVIEPLLALMLLCQCYVALMLLCIGCRTFSVGTDVLVPVCGCTDVIVQHLCLVLRVLEPVVWQWCCYANWDS